MRLLHDPTNFLFTVFLVSSFAFLFEAESIFIFIILLGQGHFILTYMYRHFAGKMTKKTVVIIGCLLLFIGALCFFVIAHKAFLSWFIFATLIIFVFHSTLDETRIFGIPDKSLRRRVVIAVTLSYVPLFASYLFVSEPSFFLKSLSFCTVLISLLMLFSKRAEVTSNSLFCLFVMLSIFIPALFTFLPLLNLYIVSGFVILYHYVRWYLYYYGKTQEKESYIFLVMWVNIFVLLLGVIYSLSPQVFYLYLLFNPVFFYGWTLLHIITTFSLAELR